MEHVAEHTLCGLMVGLATIAALRADDTAIGTIVLPLYETTTYVFAIAGPGVGPDTSPAKTPITGPLTEVALLQLDTDHRDDPDVIASAVARALGIALAEIELLGIRFESGVYPVSGGAAADRKAALEVCETSLSGKRRSLFKASVPADGGLVVLTGGIEGRRYALVYRVVRAYGPHCAQPDGGRNIMIEAISRNPKQRIPHPLASRFAPCSDARHTIER